MVVSGENSNWNLGVVELTGQLHGEGVYFPRTAQILKIDSFVNVDSLFESGVLIKHFHCWQTRLSSS